MFLVNAAEKKGFQKLERAEEFLHDQFNKVLTRSGRFKT